MAMQTRRLQTTRHFAGFDGLRLVAAVSVIFSHAFLIATGSDDREPFVRLLGPDNILGLYGVFTFFIISGFLLARSLSADASAITYTVNRVLRILPAFVFYLVVVTLLIGPLFSSMRPGEYFSWPAISAFVRTSLDGLTDSQLPGVFNYGKGRLPTVINGSLWSLRYEAQTYVFLLLLWTLLGTSGIVTGVIAITALLTWTFPPVAASIAGVAYTLPYFAGGVLMSWVHRRFGTNLLWSGCQRCSPDDLVRVQHAGIRVCLIRCIPGRFSRRASESRIENRGQDRRLLLWLVSLRLAGRADGEAANPHDGSNASLPPCFAARIRVGVRLVSCDRKAGDAVEAHRCRWDQVLGDVVACPSSCGCPGSEGIVRRGHHADPAVGQTFVALS